MSLEPATVSLPPRPKRTFGLGALLAVALLSLVVAVAGTLLLSRTLGAHSHAESASNEAPTRYQCPMHPSVVQDHPGTCPICGMKLVKIEEPKGKAAAPLATARRILFFRSPMDPKATSPSARKD